MTPKRTLGDIVPVRIDARSIADAKFVMMGSTEVDLTTSAGAACIRIANLNRGAHEDRVRWFR